MMDNAMSGYTSYEELKRQIIDENTSISTEMEGHATRRRSFAISTWLADSMLAGMVTLIACGFPPADGSLSLDNLDAEKGLEIIQSLAGNEALTKAAEGVSD